MKDNKPFCYFDPAVRFWVLHKRRGGVFLAYAFDLADAVEAIKVWHQHGTVAPRRQPIPCA